MVPALEAPGEADLSAHVDFAAVARIAREAGARASGPAAQGAFLRSLGIELRADRLRRHLTPDRADTLDAAVHRLTDPAQMGALFKTVAITAPDIAPAGFAPAG